MSANLESMFYVGREVPWHGLGTSVENAPGSAEALGLAGLDWKVLQKEVFMEDGTSVPGYKVNVRDTDNNILGMVTDRYQVVQNDEAFAFTDSLLGRGVTYETAGSLANGRRIWLLARLDKRTITDEAFEPYLVFTNSHDGNGAIRVAITPIRVVCQNTLNFALHTAKRQWACDHIGNVTNRMQEAENTLLNAGSYLDALEEEFEQLKRQSLTDNEVKKYIDLLLPAPENPGQNLIALTNVERLREDLSIRYFDSPDLKYLEKSSYRFLNAVSDFATHRQPGRRTPTYQENRFAKTVDGNPLIDQAYKMLVSR